MLPANHVASEGARSGLGDDQQDFGLEVWVDRGAGGGYAVGDALQVFVRAERDCYVKLLHVASDGTMRVVFPNGFDTNNRLAAGAVHRIGGVDDPFRLRVSEPTGEESIFAYASTAQFADVDALLAQARRTGAAAQGAADAAGIREFRARGLKIEARDAAPLRAAASTRYVVLGPAGE